MIEFVVNTVDGRRVTVELEPVTKHFGYYKTAALESFAPWYGKYSVTHLLTPGNICYTSSRKKAVAVCRALEEVTGVDWDQKSEDYFLQLPRETKKVLWEILRHSPPGTSFGARH